MRRTVLALMAVGLVLGLLMAGPGLGTGRRAAAQPPPDVNQCDDDRDNDGDGVTFTNRVNDGCPSDGTPESGGQCNNAIDDDDGGSGPINEGCGAAGTQGEDSLQCGNGLDDDGDTTAEDGCGGANPPATGPVGEPEVTNTCANATDDDDKDGKINDGCRNVGPREEGALCNNAADDDTDGVVNDGCPAVDNAAVEGDSDDAEASPAVGGIAELPALEGGSSALATDSGGLSTGAYAALAAGLAAAAVGMGGAAWYARRRWLR